jgi:hypothetical protein
LAVAQREWSPLEIWGEVARRKLAVQACQADPLELVRRMRAWDQREKREFELCSPEWAWQMDLLRWWVENPKSIILKARQLGCTWMAVAYAVWTVLYEPGANVLMYRQTEEDAKGLVFRFKQLLNSLPDYLWNGGKVVKETETQVHLEFPDGRVSLLRAMASTSAAGHGETVALAILDEFSRIDRAGDIMKSVLPAVGTKGRVCIISTANGRYNEQTGAGNHFHYLWEHAEESGIARRFLSWQAHPDRDQDWYEKSPEIQGLAPHERAEQYPSNPHEAFMFSNSLYFDKAALLWYAENAVKEPEFTGRFVRSVWWLCSRNRWRGESMSWRRTLLPGGGSITQRRMFSISRRWPFVRSSTDESTLIYMLSSFISSGDGSTQRDWQLRMQVGGENRSLCFFGMGRTEGPPTHRRIVIGSGHAVISLSISPSVSR